MAWALVIAMSSAEAVGTNRPLPRAAVLTQSPHALPSPRPRRGARVRTPLPRREAEARAQAAGMGGPAIRELSATSKSKAGCLSALSPRLSPRHPDAEQCSAGPSAPGRAEPAAGGAGSRDSSGARTVASGSHSDNTQGLGPADRQHLHPAARVHAGCLPCLVTPQLLRRSADGPSRVRECAVDICPAALRLG